MVRKYVSDMIGDDYKKWRPSDKILISQGTGSGKTWFVLKVLLRYAKEQGKHLVYFCNRKFLSQQVQSEAKKLLLNELDEDKEGLAAHLHIRTYQHSEKVFDYPRIKALDEDGKVVEYRDVENRLIGHEYEVTEDEVLYYVFDESFYMIADAGFNANTHYWYDKKEIWSNQNSISVFLAATPDPLLLYLQFQVPGRADLKTLCEKYVAAHFINENNYRERWMRSYYPPYIRLVQERDRICSVQLPYFHPGYFELEAGKAAAKKAVEQEVNRITQMCSNPYKDLFAEVERAYNTGSGLFNYVYRDERSLQERYDYLDTYYFDDMLTLAKKIAKSVRANTDKNTKEEDKQRWLVFVRRFEDAVTLRDSLRAEGCKSIAISAKITKKYDGSPCKRKGTVRKTLETLIHKQELDCDVLITTSVLDCGISLKAENVNNLAICQPDKTSFLQMIGRIRVKKGQRVNLYVRSFSPSEVRGHRDDAADMFLYLTQLYLKDEKIHRSALGYGPQPNMIEGENFLVDGMISFLPTMTLQKLLEKLDNDRNRKNYMYYDDNGNKALRIKNKLEPKANPLAVLHYLGQVYYYQVELPEYEEDPYYFLKVQLSWLGKIYDPERWIDYQSSREKLYRFLAEQSTEFEKKKPKEKDKAMDKDAQAKFREVCFEYLSLVREPPESFRQAKKRHTVGSSDYPGKSKLNEIFADMGIPYQIRSPQDKSYLIDEATGKKVLDPKTGKPKVNNKSPWYLCRENEETMCSVMEALQMKREQKKAQRMQKEAFEEADSSEITPAMPETQNPENAPQKKRQGLKVMIRRGDHEWSPGE